MINILRLVKNYSAVKIILFVKRVALDSPSLWTSSMYVKHIYSIVLSISLWSVKQYDISYYKLAHNYLNICITLYNYYYKFCWGSGVYILSINIPGLLPSGHCHNYNKERRMIFISGSNFAKWECLEY